MKSLSTSTPSVDFGRSRTWPTEAFTTYRAGKNFLMVLAFVGDSTMISGFATTVSSGHGSLEASFGPQYKPGRQARPIPVARRARGTAAPGQELHETQNLCILRL